MHGVIRTVHLRLCDNMSSGAPEGAQVRAADLTSTGVPRISKGAEVPSSAQVRAADPAGRGADPAGAGSGSRSSI